MFTEATQSTVLDRVDYISTAMNAHTPYRDAYEGLSDTEVVTLAQEGDRQAAMEVIARCESRLRRCVRTASIDVAPVPDLQQAAMLGVLDALDHYVDQGADFYTAAYTRVRGELREANREYSDKPASDPTQHRYWAALAAADGDPVAARHWSSLQRMSVTELEPLAEAGDMIAQEIIDHRYDRWEREVRRNPDTARTYEEMAAERGRGLEPAVFDMLYASVTYLDHPESSFEGTEDCTPHETIAHPDATCEFDAAVDRMLLRELLAALPEREQMVMRRHLAGETDTEIAQSMGVTRGRIGQLRARATERMRRAWQASIAED